MNASQLARKVGASSRAIGELIRTGRIKASRSKRAWDIDDKTAQVFCARNAAAIEKLKAEYVSLYWGGLSVRKLQARARDDFNDRGIVGPVVGFAEKTIYESLIKNE